MHLPPSSLSAASTTATGASRSSAGALTCVRSALTTLGHVGGAVAADVIDAHIEDVGAFGGPVPGRARQCRRGRQREQVAERPRAGGVRAFADDEERGVLLDRDGGVDGGDAGVVGEGSPVRKCAASGGISVLGGRLQRWRRRTCSGVVPQQPAATFVPNSSTNIGRCFANCSGVSG